MLLILAALLAFLAVDCGLPALWPLAVFLAGLWLALFAGDLRR